ncbi:MAG: helix-turn-helix domain-containing protein [Dermatophilaceae bacterium]
MPLEAVVPRGVLLSLSLSKREDISRGVAVGLSGRVIVKGLGRHPSVVNRELAVDVMVAVVGTGR